MGNTTTKTTKTTDEDEDQDPGKVAEDDEDQDSGKVAEDDGDDEDDEDDEEAVLATLDPKALALFERQRENLAKANASSRRRRQIIAALRKGKEETKPTPKPGPAKTTEQAPAFDPEEFMARVRAEVKGEQDAGKVQTAAERELKRAGLVLPEDDGAAERKLKRVMRMLDLDGVDPEDVADEVADLKADNPELFKRVRKVKPKTGGLGGPARIVGAPAKSAAEELFD